MKKPIEIKRLEGRAMQISWSDGSQNTLSSTKLRQSCPCAQCRENRGEGSHAAPLGSPHKRSLLRVIEASSEEETNLVNIWSIGNYAIGIQWGDGHDSGIYTYAYLHELSLLESAC